MEQFIRVLTPNDAPLIRRLEDQRLEAQGLDEMGRDMVRWDSPWREESLLHYLNSGWSVGLWDSHREANFLGYFLGQALLYFKGLTQVLWVEHISGINAPSVEFLKETAVRLSRDKHLQSVFIEGTEIKTTKR